MSNETKTVRFKNSAERYQMTAKDGFVFLDGHEREYEASYVDALIKRMPRNFEEVVAQVVAKPAIKQSILVEKQPDKMVKEKKPWSKIKWSY